MVRSCERVGWSGGKLDLVWTSLWCIDDSAWFLKAWMCCSRSFFLVIFGALSWRFFWKISRPFSWAFVGGCMHEPFMVLFPLILLPNPWERGLDFGVFVGLGFVVFLVEILRFLLIQRVLVDHNLATECPWGIPTIPKVLFEIVERIRRSGVGFGGVDPWVLFISSCPGVTGLPGVCPVWDLPRVNCLTRVPLGRVVAGQFLAVLEVFCLGFWRDLLPCRLCFGGVLVPGPREVTEALWNICCVAAAATGLTGVTGLTGAGHQSDRCSTGCKPCKFPLCELVCFGSEGCLLVPRISSTLVATWSWPTWLVDSETCVGSCVHLVGVSISFEKNFYRLPFTPPSLVRHFGPSMVSEPVTGLDWL
jgi:hypothetical protein